MKRAEANRRLARCGCLTWVRSGGQRIAAAPGGLIIVRRTAPGRGVGWDAYQNGVLVLHRRLDTLAMADAAEEAFAQHGARTWTERDALARALRLPGAVS